MTCDKWATVFGAWGDSIACLGNVAALGRTYNLLVYSMESQVARFALEQPFCRKVRWIRPASRASYERMVAGAVQGASSSWVDELLHGTEILPEQLIWTHLQHADLNAKQCRWWRGARLPQEALAWADAAVERARSRANGRPVILLQSWSVNSCPREGQWPHWPEAIAWLSEAIDALFILVGLELEAPPERPIRNMIDLRGCAPSMMAVFALADRCDLVITTCNGLSLWSVVSGATPAVVCFNRALAQPRDASGSYFAAWIDRPPNRVLAYEAGLAQFKDAVSAGLGGLRPKTLDSHPQRE